MKEQAISIKSVLDQIYRHPLLNDIPLETAVDYCVEFMRIIKCPEVFVEKCAVLTPSNYRCSLPEDYFTMIQVRESENMKRSYIYATDSFHFSTDKTAPTGLTYKIQGSIIYTSTKETPIEIAYNAIETDDLGFPTIPDNSHFTRALRAFIKREWFEIKFDEGKISQQVFNQAQQDYAWAVGACQTEFVNMSLDEAESFFNSFRTLIIRNYSHATQFRNECYKEHIKVQ